MTAAFVGSLQSEWIKKRRSLAGWLVVVGALFTPLIIVVARLIYQDGLAKLYTSDTFWRDHWNNCWESVAIFLLPIGEVLAASLITQLEYKNNTWKQLHTTPLNFTTIYFSKLVVMIAMLLQFFILFNIAIFISAIIPLVIGEVSMPTAPIDVLFYLQENTLYFIDCLPIIALQYLIALNFKNFLVPIGTGFLMWVLSLATLRWEYGYLFPYSYTIFNFLKEAANGKAAIPDLNFHLLALGYFVLFTAIGYALYVTKKDKG